MKDIKLPQDDMVMPEETPRDERDALISDAYMGFQPQPHMVLYTVIAICGLFVLGALFIK